MSLRLYLNEIGAPEGSWSLDDGDPKTERCFDSVVLVGIWHTKVSALRGVEPYAWLENGPAASAVGIDQNGSLHRFRDETGMVER